MNEEAEREKYCYSIPMDTDSVKERWVTLKNIYSTNKPPEIFEMLQSRLHVNKQAAIESHLLIELTTSNQVKDILKFLFTTSQSEWRRAEISMITYQLECGMLVIYGTQEELYIAAEMIYRIRVWLDTAITNLFIQQKVHAKNVKKKTEAILGKRRDAILNEKPLRVDTREMLASQIFTGLQALREYADKTLIIISKMEEALTEDYHEEYYKRIAVLVNMLNRCIVQPK